MCACSCLGELCERGESENDKCWGICEEALFFQAYKHLAAVFSADFLEVTKKDGLFWASFVRERR